MSESWAYLGGALLAVATVPQAVRLLRTRTARDLTWGFVLLNVLGLLLLAARAVEIGEPAFVAVNVVGVAFWGLAAVTKLAELAG